MYSNLGTFQNQSFAAGGATQQVLNTITRMAADDLNLVGTPPYSVNGFRFMVTNLNAVDVSASPLVRFYRTNGAGGGPGTLIEARTYNPIVFHAGVVGTIKTSSTFVLPTASIWAGITFDNNSGTTGATAAQLDNLALGIFSPPELGSSLDQYFVTTAAGSFASGDPVGTITNFGGTPPADFGWEILTAQDVDLSITKSADVATASPGGSVVYTITASNAGPDPVFDARVVDTFPAALTCSWTCAGSPTCDNDPARACLVDGDCLLGGTCTGAGNTCAASGTGDINDATVDLAVGGSVTYTATCAVSPDAIGTLVNTAAIFAPGTAVDASILNNRATNDVTLIAPPTIDKAFAPLAISVGGTTTLTFTLTNPNAGTALTGVAFTDSFPSAGLEVAATPNATTTGCGSPTFAPMAGDTIGELLGRHHRRERHLHGDRGRHGDDGRPQEQHHEPRHLDRERDGRDRRGVPRGRRAAEAVAPPTIAKAFGAASIAVNGTTTLTFTLTNPNGTALSGVAFTDALPAGLEVANPNGLTGMCGGTVTATAGSGSVALANGSLPAKRLLDHRRGRHRHHGRHQAQHDGRRHVGPGFDGRHRRGEPLCRAADGYADRDADQHADNDLDRHRDRDGHRYRDRDADQHPDRDAHQHRDRDGHRDGDSDGDRHCDRDEHRHRDCDSIRDSHADGNFVRHGDADRNSNEHGNHDTDGDRNEHADAEEHTETGRDRLAVRAAIAMSVAVLRRWVLLVTSPAWHPMSTAMNPAARVSACPRPPHPHQPCLMWENSSH